MEQHFFCIPPREKGNRMIVYMTQGQKTVLSRITVEGLPLHYLSVGRGYFAFRML